MDLSPALKTLGVALLRMIPSALQHLHRSRLQTLISQIQPSHLFCCPVPGPKALEQRTSWDQLHRLPLQLLARFAIQRVDINIFLMERIKSFGSFAPASLTGSDELPVGRLIAFAREVIAIHKTLHQQGSVAIALLPIWA